MFSPLKESELVLPFCSGCLGAGDCRWMSACTDTSPFFPTFRKVSGMPSKSNRKHKWLNVDPYVYFNQLTRPLCVVSTHDQEDHVVETVLWLRSPTTTCQRPLTHRPFSHSLVSVIRNCSTPAGLVFCGAIHYLGQRSLCRGPTMDNIRKQPMMKTNRASIQQHNGNKHSFSMHVDIYMCKNRGFVAWAQWEVWSVVGPYWREEVMPAPPRWSCSRRRKWWGYFLCSPPMFEETAAGWLHGNKQRQICM